MSLLCKKWDKQVSSCNPSMISSKRLRVPMNQANRGYTKFLMSHSQNRMMTCRAKLSPFIAKGSTSRTGCAISWQLETPLSRLASKTSTREIRTSRCIQLQSLMKCSIHSNASLTLRINYSKSRQIIANASSWTWSWARPNFFSVTRRISLTSISCRKELSSSKTQSLTTWRRALLRLSDSWRCRHIWNRSKLRHILRPYQLKNYSISMSNDCNKSFSIYYRMESSSQIDLHRWTSQRE